MKPLILLVRTSFLRWAAIPMIALALTVIFLRSDFWKGSWPETGVAGQIPAYFLSIVAAGAAAWVSGASARHRLTELTAAAAVPPIRTESYRLAVTTAYLVFPYLVGQLAVVAVSASSAGAGRGLWAGYAIMGLLVMVAATVWGWIIGRYLTSVYAALTAVLSWMIFETFPGDAAYLGVVSGPPWLTPDPDSLWIRFAAWAVLVIIVIGTASRLVSSRSELARRGLVVLGAAGLIAAVVGTPGVTARTPVSEPLCIAGRIEMCVWPESAQYSGLLETVNARLGDLPQELDTPPRLYEYGLLTETVTDGRTTGVEVSGDFTITEGNLSDVALAVSNAVISENLKGCDWDAILNAKDQRPEAVRRWVELRLNANANPGYTTSGVSPEMQSAWDQAGEVFQKLAPADQNTWVRTNLTATRDAYCA